MPKTSPEVDRYIENAAPFAQPILTRIRKAFHKGCPDLEETMKWGVPHFDYKGVLGNMAAFKQHVGWGFWKAKLMSDPHGILDAKTERTAMGGSKVTDVKNLAPEKVLVEYVREAARLNEEGVKVERPKRAPAAPAEVPDDLAAALEKNAKARAAFEQFPPSHRREYIDWITEARQEATRQKRLTQAIEWIAEGKSRNWKYERPRKA
ncbi:MAG: hypothetical protein QOH21_324 [Acidobacteriota bacterium]|jgi:uncharacterized protein YdeI (YjbR/CyaY-like superfamily)|nr:hypothetical protein [Acidobacteriota bacterium]